MRAQTVIVRDLGELWLALLVDNRLVELDVVPDGQRSWLGAVFKARVSATPYGVAGDFVDLGLPQPGFLVPSKGAPPARRGETRLVEVVREAVGAKGLRVRDGFRLAGVLSVLVEGGEGVALSRRINDPQERSRLAEALADAVPEGTGAIVRSAADGAPVDALRDDFAVLVAERARLVDRARDAAAPSLVREPDPPALAFARDTLREEPARLAVAGLDPHERSVLEAALRLPIHEHGDPGSALDAHRLQRGLRELLARRVDLRSGGALTIEPTEALVAVDVDAGIPSGGGGAEAAFVRTNLEAVREVARQARLRDLGGLIVVDLVDMASPRDRARVDAELAGALRADPAKHDVLPTSAFSVAQITRERRRAGLLAQLTKPCPSCGEGRAVRASLRARSLLRELRRRAKATPGRRFVLRADDPRVLDEARSIFDHWGVASGMPDAARVEITRGRDGISERG